MFPEGFEARIDAAMREIGYEHAPFKPALAPDGKTWISGPYDDKPNIFCKEYVRSGFKFRMTITTDDIARHGEADVIARRVGGAAKAGR
jgi:hypothetical protein